MWRFYATTLEGGFRLLFRHPKPDRARIRSGAERQVDSAFGEPPLDHGNRSDAYGLIGLHLGAVALSFLAVVGTGLVINPEPGSPTYEVVGKVIQGFAVLLIYACSITFQVVCVRAGFWRRDEKRWEAAGRPEGWVPDPRSQPHDIDFLIALVPTAAISLLLVSR